jgi:hypothetical protein
VPSTENPAGRILMTGYDRFWGNTSCHVYSSVDGGGSWAVIASVPAAFECSVASLGEHHVYLNARHMRAPPTSTLTTTTSTKGQAPIITPVPRVQATSVNDGFNFSRDYGLGWLWDPDDQGVLGATVSTNGGEKLFFAVAAGPATNPLSQESEENSGRNNLVLHRSTTAGRVWDSVTVHEGVAGYVDAVDLGNNLIGLYFETELTGDLDCTGACALVFLTVNSTALFPQL